MIAHDHEYLTVREAAELLRVSVPTIRRWIAAGRLRAVRFGSRSVRVRRSEIRESRTGRPDDWKRYAVRLGDPRVTEGEVATRLRALQERMSARRGGKPFEPSLPLIHEARDERDER